MQKLLCSLFLTFTLTSISIGQNFEPISTRHISVTGSAEITVLPDEIELEIVLKEHGEKGKKEDLESIEDMFFKVLKKHNIPKNKVTFNNSGYYWYYWWSYRNNYLQQKRYNVVLGSSTDFLSLMNDLDFKGVNSLRISKTTNSKLQELRKEVKIQAVKAAKEKATYLLESIDEKVGQIISIEELSENPNYYWRRGQNLISNVAINASQNANEIENVTTIKLRYEIKAMFQIED